MRLTFTELYGKIVPVMQNIKDPTKQPRDERGRFASQECDRETAHQKKRAARSIRKTKQTYDNKNYVDMLLVRVLDLSEV